MRIVALGGAGAMGRVAVRTLATHAGIERLVVADRDVDAATGLADELGGSVAACRVDLADDASLRGALAGADVVLNTAGPFYRFGATVLRAAIDAGAHYLDICDDPAPTLAMLALHERATAAGVIAVVGMGASPGVPNLLARLAGDGLDRVDRIVTGWPEDPAADFRSPGVGTSAAAVHWVHQFSHPIPVLRGGRLVEVEPLEAVDVDYPEVGRGTVFTVGHPEAVTLGRAFPGLQDSTNVMVISPDAVAVLRDVAAQVRAGLEDAAGAALLPERFGPAYDGSAPAAPFGWLFALAEGRVGDRPRTVAAGLTRYPRGGMAGATGVPLAVAAGMLIDGLVTEHGVHPPETSVPAGPFFARLEPHLRGDPAQPAVVVTASP